MLPEPQAEKGRANAAVVENLHPAQKADGGQKESAALKVDAKPNSKDGESADTQSETANSAAKRRGKREPTQGKAQ